VILLLFLKTDRSPRHRFTPVEVELSMAVRADQSQGRVSLAPTDSPICPLRWRAPASFFGTLARPTPVGDVLAREVPNG